MSEEEIDYDIDLSGETCEHMCEIHNEPCMVVMKYNNEKIQRTLKALQDIEGIPPHDADSDHWCELCSRAMREGRDRDFWIRCSDGIVRSKYSPQAKADKKK
jgi:hypothetical protein